MFVWLRKKLHAPVVSTLTAKSPLREQQQMIGSNISINGSQKGLISGMDIERSTEFYQI